MEIEPFRLFLQVALMEDQVYGDSCGLGTHGQLEWCNGEEGEVEEDL